MIRRVGLENDLETQQRAYAMAREAAAYEIVHVAQAIDEGLHLFVVPDADLMEFRRQYETAHLLWSYGPTTALPAVLLPESPCWTTVTPAADGGQHVLVHIPTFDGGARISVLVQRDSEGDWYVELEGLDRFTLTDGSPLDETIILGAPDEPTPSKMPS